MNEDNGKESKTEVEDFTLKGTSNPFEEKERKKKKKEKEPRVSFFKLFRFVNKVDIFLIIIGSIAAILHGAVLPSFALIFGSLIDALNNPNPTNLKMQMTKLSLAFIYIGVGTLLVTFVQTSSFMSSAERQAKKIRESYLKAILRQNIGWFDEVSSGQLSSRISADTILIQAAIGEKLGNFIQYTATFIFGFILGFYEGWQVSLVLLAVTPLIAIAGGVMVKFLSSLTESGQKAYATAGAIAAETLGGIRTIAAFNGEISSMERYNQNLVAARKIGMKKSLVSGFSFGTVNFLFFAAFALAFWYGSTLVADGKLTGGEVLSALFAIIIGGFSLGQTSSSLEAISKGTGAAYKMYSTMEKVSSIDPTSDEGLKPANCKGNIGFKKVSFRYPTRTEVQVLKDFSLKIKPGQRVALVGQSGCGKSSTISLIQRFYDPESGTITFDDYKLSDLNVTWLRNQFGYVGQEPVLFSGTIAENIAYGKDSATQEEIEEAAKLANAHNFIKKFPDGYNTFVGEKGAQLSGGQKQRIAIARSIIRKPKILLLDEATSALDNKSEKIVQEALDRVMKDRTTIVIAHRLSTIQNVDKIFVIDKGVIIESGTHDELMALGKNYKGLVIAQGGSDEKGEQLSEKLSPKLREEKLTQSGEYIFYEEEPVSKEEKKEEIVKKSKCFCFKKSKKEKKEEEVSIKRIYALNRKEIPFMMLGTIGSIVNGVINPVFAVIFSQIVAIFYSPPSQISQKIVEWILVLVGISVGTLLGNVIQMFFFGISGEYLTQRLRQLSFKAIVQNEIGWFDWEENASGILTSRLASDAALVEGLSGIRLGLTVQNISAIIAGLVIAFIAGWKLTLVVLSTGPLMVFSSVMDMQVMKGLSGKTQTLLAEANNIASEAFSNIRTVAAFSNEQKILEKYVNKLEAPYRTSLKGDIINGALVASGEFFLFISYFVSFYYGGILIADGENTFLEVMKVFMAIAMTATAVGQAASFLPDSGKAQAAASAVFKLIDRVSEINPLDEKQGTQLPLIKGDIEFKNVEFTYPSRPDALVLKGINFEVKSGQVVALVGQSGCGKSSIVSLLERFYNIQAGEITIDGVNIKDLNTRWLRKQFGYVGQEPVLFSGTIGENVAFSKEGRCTMEEIEEAAKLANAHNFIKKFPDGYNTFVGEKGAQLSGGQKQRIAIARAIIKDPKILLLDEATSALDTESEKIVQEALDRVMKDRTTIVIAHRLSTIQNVDKIFVIDNGVIVEEGSHNELMEQKGIYYKLVKKQTK